MLKKVRAAIFQWLFADLVGNAIAECDAQLRKDFPDEITRMRQSVEVQTLLVAKQVATYEAKLMTDVRGELAKHAAVMKHGADAAEELQRLLFSAKTK